LRKLLAPLDIEAALKDFFMSDQPAPSSPQPPEANGSLSQVIEKVGPIARKLWVTSRPTLSQGLKATIGLLEQAIQKIDTQIANDPTDVPPLNLEPLQKAGATFWTKTQPLWVKLIAGVRGKLPEDISTQLTDRALSGVVAGMFLLLLVLTTHLPSGASSARVVPRPVAVTPAARPMVATAPPQTYQRPVATPVPQPQTLPQSFPAALTAPDPSVNPANLTPSVAAVPPATPAPTLAAQPIVPSVAATASTAPAPVKPSAPVKKLTAQEKLLASLQETAGDQGKLIATAQPNKAAGRLQVNLQSDWYQLDVAQQDQLAQTLFTKAQALKFRSLELLDGKGEILARSPVVGNEMVVLLRQAIDAM
jgi:hypothetical protein